MIVSRATLLTLPLYMASTKFTHIRSNFPESVSVVLPERPQSRVKATRSTPCVNQIPNTVLSLCSTPACVRQPPRCPSISRPRQTRTRACAHLFNVQKAECTREKYSHYIALAGPGPVLLRDRGFTIQRGLSERKERDTCKHTRPRIARAQLRRQVRLTRQPGSQGQSPEFRPI